MSLSGKTAHCSNVHKQEEESSQGKLLQRPYITSHSQTIVSKESTRQTPAS